MPKDKKNITPKETADAAALQSKINDLMGPVPEQAPAKHAGTPPKIKIVEADTTPDEPSTAPEVTGIPSSDAPTEAEEIGDTALKGDEVSVGETLPLPIDDVVDDIAASDSDELLKAEDDILAKAFLPEKKSEGHKIRRFFATWWHNKKARYITLAVVILILVALGAIPKTRYTLLNKVGIRASSSILIQDGSTFRPLKNVTVTLNGVSAQTDKDGKVLLGNLKLGNADLIIEKRGFATINQKLVVGWGSNPLGEKQLAATGTRYTLLLTDYLSGLPLENIEAVSGEASAVSDATGKLVITLGQEELATDITVQSDGKRTEVVPLPEDPTIEVPLQLVPSHKHSFISKRSGKYGLYSIDVDGKNESLVLAGTGSERSDMALLPHDTADVVAFVSTASNTRNDDGYLLSDLQVINLKDQTVTRIAQAEKIRFVGWAGNRLVYIQTVSGASAADPSRTKLMAYNYPEDTNKELASSNYFNDVAMVGDTIYYATAVAFQNSKDIGFMRVNADNSNRASLLDREVWNLFRTAYDRLDLSVEGDWYEYTPGESVATANSNPPANQVSRIYTDSPDKKHSLWVEERDGKGTLLSFDISAKTDTVIQTIGGLKTPVSWIDNDTVIYRLTKVGETADYVVSLKGGEAHKLTDVTDVVAIDDAYNY